MEIRQLIVDLKMSSFELINFFKGYVSKSNQQVHERLEQSHEGNIWRLQNCLYLKAEK